MREDAGRAVSDTLGFVLVFGLVLSTVSVVYVGGFDVLTDARNTQQFANTERALDVLDANVEDLAVRGAPRRTTEMVLSGGDLGFGSPVTFEVTANGTTYGATLRPLVYRADDGDRLVYSNGALFRQYDDGGTAMFDRPRFAGGDRTLVPLVVTDAAGSAVDAESTRRVRVRTTVTGRTVRSFADDPMTLAVSSPRADAWERYLETELDAACTRPAADRVRCPLDADEVYVQRVTVGVDIQ